MKKIIFITLLIYTIAGYSQVPIIWTYGNIEINFEDTNEYKYIGFDTNWVWQITIPQKELLSMPTKAIVADTNLYYRNNLKTSFQFKLVLGEADAYSINFYHKFDFEKNKDGGIIETSYNNGQTWQNILFDTLIRPAVLLAFEGFYNSSDTISSYNNQPGFTGLKSELVSAYYFFIADYSIKGDTMLLRFTIASDSVNSINEGWVLDNFIFGGHMLYNVNDIKQKSDLNIYPNPSYAMLYIESETGQIKSIELISLTGQVLLSDNDKDITSIDISNLQRGFYFILCTNSKNQNLISKIIKI